MCSRKQEELSSSSLSLRLSDDPLPRTKSSVWPLLIHIVRTIHQKAVKRFCRRMHAHKNLHSLSGAIYRPARTACGPSGSAIFNYHAASAGTGTIPIGRAGIPRNLIGIEAPADGAIRARQVLLRSKPLHSQFSIPSILLALNVLGQLSCLSTHESLPESLRCTQSRRAARSAHLRKNVPPSLTPIIAFLLLLPSFTNLLLFFLFSRIGHSRQLQHRVPI